MTMISKENPSRNFIQGHTYVIDEALLIDKIFNGDVQAYKEEADNLLWIKDVMGLEFTASNEGDGYMHSRRVVGRSGIPWLISIAWCRDITDKDKENENQGTNKTKLSQTTELMNSADYKDRFKAEYLQLKIRMEGLRTMLHKYKAGTLSFKPSCSYDLLNGQYKAMILYASYLEERAKIENIDLEDI